MSSVNGSEGVTSSLAVVEAMLKRLRRCLDLDSNVGQDSSAMPPPPSSSAAASQPKRRRLVGVDESNKKSAVALILDAMFNGIRMERVVIEIHDCRRCDYCPGISGARNTTLE